MFIKKYYQEIITLCISSKIIFSGALKRKFKGVWLRYVKILPRKNFLIYRLLSSKGGYGVPELQTSSEEFWALRDKIRSRLFQGLNEPQFKVVESGAGPVLCLAGAGSGKTTAMVHRIMHLLIYGPHYNEKDYAPLGVTEQDLVQMKQWLAEQKEGAKPARLPRRILNLISYQGIDSRSILAITFTNKAAQEMKARLSFLVGPSSNEMWVMTFHAACVRILRQEITTLGYERDFGIYDTQDQLQVIKDVLKQLNLDEKKFVPRAMIQVISRFKSELKNPMQAGLVAKDYFEGVAVKIYERYQKLLRQNNSLDFDDLIMLTVRLFQEQPEVLEKFQNRFRYIMVDEYQDTNHAQYMLINLLASKHQNICVVGDDDQSIYGFRQADIRNILEFERDYPEAKVIKLEENYRSSKKILEAANEVISNNKGRKKKKLWTQNPEGQQLVQYQAVDEKDEARFVAEQVSKLIGLGAEFQDCAVLIRTNAQSRALEEWFIRAQIPYKIVGGTKFYERKEIKDTIAYLKCLSNPSDSVSLTRIINVPRRGIGDATVDKIVEYGREHDLSLGQALADIGQISLGAKATKGINEFLKLISKFRGMLGNSSITELTETILADTGYWSELLQDNSYESQSRMENLREFLTKTKEYDQTAVEPSLGEFLSQVSLVSDLDTYQDESKAVVIMTMHSAKGLEFTNVFLIGLEEGVFPHSRSLYEPDDLEEERRLCYVALTRAKEKLYLVQARQRNLYGKSSYNVPSRFLAEIPQELREEYKSGEEFYKTTKAPVVLETVKSKLAGSLDYSLGDKVEHNKWGQGVVVAMKGEGEDKELSVAFPGQGIKLLIAKFAPLRKVN